jgi:hypothetical protein
VNAPTENALKRLTATDWFEIGRTTAPAYARGREWLFRRVEAIEFVGRRSVRRTVTVSFEKPRHLPRLKKHAPKGTKLVPVAMMQKWPPTMDFELEDAAGIALARYTGSTTRELDFGLLLGMVDRALTDSQERIPEYIDPRLERELAEIVDDPQPTQENVTEVVNELSAELEDKRPDKPKYSAGPDELDPVAATIDLAARLSGGSILWVAVSGPPAADRVVKFSYRGAHLMRSPKFVEDQGHPKLWVTWRRRILARVKTVMTSCSWRGRTLIIPLLHGGQGIRYHLNIRAPAGSVEMQDVTALALPAAKPSGYKTIMPESLSVAALAAKYPQILDPPDEWVGPESSGYFMDYGRPTLLATTSKDALAGCCATDIPLDASVEIIDRQAHVNFGAAGAPSHRALLQLKLKGAREGLVQRCFFAAVVIAALLGVVYSELGTAAEHLEATVVLLSIVPVVLGYVVVNPDEQPFEHKHLTGVRLLALISGSLPIVGALAIVLTSGTGDPDPDINTLKDIWWVLMGLVLIAALGLFVSWIASASPNGRDEPTPGQRSRA